MRTMPTALSRMTRKVLTTAAIAAAITGGSVLTAGTAAAAIPSAESCTAAVTGPIGEVVTVNGAAVKDLVKRGAQEAKSIIVVHDLTIWPDHLAREIAKETLTVGSVPEAQGGNVSGAVIGTAVRNALKDEAGLGALNSTKQKTLDTIANKVAGNCGLSVFASNYVAPTTNPPASQPGAAPTTAPGTPAGSPAAAPGVPMGSGGAAVPPRDYSGLPVASAPNAPSAGIAVPPGLRYPPSSGVPGSAEFGILGADTGNGADTGQADVRNAGNADALAAPASASQVQLPMLLAVVALAGVTAALVRTWVLRRAT
ncbi:hypothetical protein DI005_01830 [Prauserella sp. PE36]|nr:hypothetical protein DI005_01830 [Prauserella sp. PE36]